ncbi:MAG TPA: ABC transporter permease [Petrimonas sp.]|jgi:ABC-type lipoprotein release transport system permease subunit|nr:ABC transporter permease [Petrimonas sp.]
MIKLAWLNLQRNPYRAMSIVSSVFIAAFFCILFGSFKKGVLNSSADSILKISGGHIEIRSKSYSQTRSIDDIMCIDSAILDSISILPHVKRVLPTLRAYALISHSSSSSSRAVVLVGIDPESEKDRIRMVSEMVEGEWFSEFDRGVIIGENMRNLLNIGIGDTIAVMGVGYHGVSAVGLFPVQGVIGLPVATVDINSMFMTLSAAQELFQADDCYSEIYIMSDKLDKVEVIESFIQSDFSSDEYEIRDWKLLIDEHLVYFRITDAIGFIVMFFLYLLVGSNILGAVILMTKERKLEFSVLVSIGMPRDKLSRTMFYELIMVAFVGLILAVIVSLPIVYYFSNNPIPLYGEAAETLKKFFIYAEIYLSFDLSLFIEQFLIVFCICLAVIAYPVIIIQRLKVDEGLSKRES